MRLKLTFLFILPLALWSQEYSYALEQIGAQEVVKRGLTGKGVKVGIIDGGFMNADESPLLRAHFEHDRIKYYKDFITPNLAPYGGSKGQDDGHGTTVWQNIGGIDLVNNIQFGLATESEFYLARTDHYVYERREEEEYLIEALKEMISQGVRVVNISLGYTNGYSRRNENYTPEQIDGKSTWVTRAIDKVIEDSGVIVIVSAGNDGDSRWQTLSAPADSKNLISVGASKLNSSEEMSYSSKGHEGLDYVKPDVSCFATSGTSFSAPIITGLVACLLEYRPDLSRQEVKDLLTRSATLSAAPNNYIGYGVPDASEIFAILEGNLPDGLTPTRVKGSKYTLDLPDSVSGRAALYHKTGWKVKTKEVINTKKKLKIRRPENIESTTVIIKNRLPVEIIWED